jgi:hypothetical protein
MDTQQIKQEIATMSKKAKKAPVAAKPIPGHNQPPNELTADEKRELFLKDKGAYEKVLATKKKADAAMRNVGKTIKSDGFTLAQIKVAIALDEPEGEADVRAELTQTMQAARWVGSDIGAQLDLFVQPNRTPAADRAFDEGKQASMENKPRKPPYDPSTAQFRSWMKGFNEHQGTLITKIGQGNGAEAEAQTQ